MILRKPYAFFIKIFKPLHIIIALMILYLIYYQNKLLSIFSNYIHYNELVKSFSIDKLIYVIPVLIILLNMIILGIMYRNNKPIRFYFISILSFIVVIIINIYSTSYAILLTKQVTLIKTIKLVSDLTLINIIIELIMFVFLVIRGFGIDIKKFDFSSDLLKIDISDEDREEFELSLNVDVDLKKRERRKQLRVLKYKYLENRFKINLIFLIFCFLISSILLLSRNTHSNVNSMNFVYSSQDFSFKVNNSYIINENDNTILVLDVAMRSDKNNSIKLDDFSVLIRDNRIKPSIQNNNIMYDLGTLYNENKLSNNYKDYLLIFNIPSRLINSEKILEYSRANSVVKIKLDTKLFKYDIVNVSVNIGETLKIDSLNNFEINIKEFDIQDKYRLEYEYCYKNNQCVDSIEYIKPTISSNFDKVVLKLNIGLNSGSNESIINFIDLLNNYGSIYYETDAGNYIQDVGFEEIKSSKKQNNYTYIGVNKDIIQAKHIKLVFKIRSSVYEYVLK